jgi:cytochrome b subunit of formate dehydrogenase
MIPFQVAPERLDETIALYIVLVFIAGYAVHWFRRAFREPSPTGPTPSVSVPGDRVKYYDIVERLFHWTDFIVMGMMMLTGIAIFFPGSLNFALAPFGVQGTAGEIDLHLTFVWALLGLIVIHVVWDTAVARGFWNIWPGVKDIRDAAKRAKNFVGWSDEYPRMAKYDAFMKTFHWGLTVSLIVLGITGIYFWNPYGIMPNLGYATENLFRVLHDIFAFLLVGLVIGHIYFAVIPENWPILKAMITGTMSKDFYMKHYDPARWKAKQSTGLLRKEFADGGDE